MFVRVTRYVLAALLAAFVSTASAEDPPRLQEQERERVMQQGAAAEPLQAQEREREREELRQMLRAEGALGDPELAALGPDLDRFAEQNGDPAQLRNMVRAAVGEGCTGPCLGMAIRETNRVMSRGVNCEEACRMVQAAVQEENRERVRTQKQGSPEERGQQVRARVEAQLQERERDQGRKVPAAVEADRDRDRDRDLTGDQDRDRARDHDRSHDSGGGRGGKR